MSLSVITRWLCRVGRISQFVDSVEFLFDIFFLFCLFFSFGEIILILSM